MSEQELNKFLKVGDKLYSKHNHRWSDEITYKFSTVERLTKTQAILSNGVRLINASKRDWFGDFGYQAYGGSFVEWYLETPEILEKHEKNKERQMINSWFDKRKFSHEDKRIVYLKFKELNLL
jgi:hypothetical protein